MIACTNTSRMLEVCHLNGEADTPFPVPFLQRHRMLSVLLETERLQKLHTVTMCHCKTLVGSSFMQKEQSMSDFAESE